ncbi:YggS family pyridoxal phosphate-dependent enzyme [Campylobacter ureolyticus]|uniref:YggS family pyridoxal phosphate-dependent enzyme n=1 Tax=Campylobacter ureolyticus TaxID=827 RepID=UPI0004687BF2|nr:YggS family pyridoxal phosphate-dependent enzyme [Campylobacter ureolyticus]QIX87140.1 YggS family pyridoxal phosphate-dependent enzyme [Campylobacter ureolyticus]STA70532.1 Predicted enzyme with a TIM-barrel fold [Campylobacter ureolyticus]
MNLNKLLDEINKLSNGRKVELVAVSKYVGPKEIKELFNKGQMSFGENRVQDLVKKNDELKELNLNWHFIGTLQTNKINALLKIRPTLWQSCNSIKLAQAVDKRLNYRLDTLLEINVADEDSKTGLDLSLAKESYCAIKESCKNLNLKGIMCIGAHSDDELEVAKSFEKAYVIYESLQNKGAKICSMGMSSDYKIAIKCGSNMIRVGSLLFK